MKNLWKSLIVIAISLFFGINLITQLRQETPIVTLEDSRYPHWHHNR